MLLHCNKSCGPIRVYKDEETFCLKPDGPRDIIPLTLYSNEDARAYKVTIIDKV